MEERYSKQQQQRTKKLSTSKKRPSSTDSSTDSSDLGKPQVRQRIKWSWKNFLGLFARGSASSHNQNQYKRDFSLLKKGEVEVKDDDLFLCDVVDELAIAVSLPVGVCGKDVNVKIELNALGKQPSNDSCLRIAEETASVMVFKGCLRTPEDTTVEKISTMPLYFINSAKVRKSDGTVTNKIETVIKPLEDNLPQDVDKSIPLTDIALKIRLQSTSKQWNIDTSAVTSLPYRFITHAPNTFNILKSKTQTFLNDIDLEDKDYNDQAKAIVKEILQLVMNKVDTYDVATQYSKMITSVNKEIDVQKSLLKHVASKCREDEPLIIPQKCSWSNKYMPWLCPQDNKQVLFATGSKDYLSVINEREEDIYSVAPTLKTSEDTFYPQSTTTYPHSNAICTDSEGSLLYLKAPVNSPKDIHAPRYILSFDDHSKFKKERNYDADTRFYKQLLQETVKKDIDKTLDLLETAKVKLLTYLDSSMDLSCLQRKLNVYDCQSPQFEKEFFAQKNIAKAYTNPGQFFLASSPKNEKELPIITSLEEEKDNQSLKKSTKTVTIDGDCLYRSKSERLLDETLLTRYGKKELEENEANAGNIEEKDEKDEKNKVKKNDSVLAYEMVERDIDVMIRDLLRETDNIKMFVLDRIKLPEEDVEAEVDQVMESILQVVEAEEETYSNDSLEEISSVCINYCLIGENKSSVSTLSSKTIREPINCEQGEHVICTNALAVSRQQRKLKSSSFPKLTVKGYYSRRKSVLKTNDSFLQRLDRNTGFMRQIYSELCRVQVQEDGNGGKNDKKKSGNQPGTSKEKETNPKAIKVISEQTPEETVGHPVVLMKSSGKLDKPNESVDLKNYHRRNSSIDEVLEETVNLEEVESSKKNNRKQRKHRLAITIDMETSSEETVFKLKDMLTARASTAAVSQINRISSTERSSVISLEGYEADSSMPFVITSTPHLLGSMSELNTKDEISVIEVNAKINDERIKASEESFKGKGKGKKPKKIVYESAETIQDSESLESLEEEKAAMRKK